MAPVLQDRQLQQLWAETKIGDILPWEDVEREAEKLLESIRANERGPENSGANQEQDDDRIVDRDETDPYNEVIFGRRRPDSVAIEWTGKTVYVLEFKLTLDQRQDYREQGERRARVQHDVLVKSLDTVAKEAEGENAGWTVKLIIFVGGTCGSVHVQTFNNNLKELGVVESKRNTIRRGLVGKSSGKNGEGKFEKPRVDAGPGPRALLCVPPNRSERWGKAGGARPAA